MTQDGNLDIVAVIADEYFGTDKSKSYVKHDFLRAVEGFIQREVMLNVIIASNRSRYTKQKHVDAQGNESISFGDFDPDNAGFMYSIFKNYEIGAMLNLRLLLNSKEAGTGGSFVKRLTQLNSDDFMYHYLHKTKSSSTIPPLLIRPMIELHGKGQRIFGNEFIIHHKEYIQTHVDVLIAKAKKFDDANYKEKIISNYEALKFHKDSQPNKYEIKKVSEDYEALQFSRIIRRDTAVVNTVLIAKALNDFAEIVELYRLLANNVDGLQSPGMTLNNYITRTFQLFTKNISVELQEKCINEIEDKLSVTLRLSLWPISK